MFLNYSHVRARHNIVRTTIRGAMLMAAASFVWLLLAVASATAAESSSSSSSSSASSTTTATESNSNSKSKASSSVVLTASNFHEVTKGKTVFIKFFAPWCGHCQELAPEWEKLAADWNGHAHGLVGEVDCTVEKQLCQGGGDGKQQQHSPFHMDIQGLPTFKYGDPSHHGAFLEEPSFFGDEQTSYDVLSSFVQERNFGVPLGLCTPGNLQGCQDQETRDTYDSFWTMSLLDLNHLIASKESELDAAENYLQTEFTRMQTVYDELSNKKEMDAAASKRSIKVWQEIIQKLEQH